MPSSRRSPPGSRTCRREGRFIGELVEPFVAGRPFRRGIHDVEHERPSDEPWETASAGAVLVVDGVFLHRDELTGLWDFHTCSPFRGR